MRGLYAGFGLVDGWAAAFGVVGPGGVAVVVTVVSVASAGLVAAVAFDVSGTSVLMLAVGGSWLVCVRLALSLYVVEAAGVVS